MSEIDVNAASMHQSENKMDKSELNMRSINFV